MQPPNDLVRRVHRVSALLDTGDLDKALTELMHLRGLAATLAVRSPTLIWLSAVVADYRGEVEEAFAYIQEAARLDPFCERIRQSQSVIARRLRERCVARA